MADRIPMSELESYLWGSAVLLRTNIDAGSYKQYIFPLLFFKRLCDVYDEETADFVAQYGDDADLFADDHTFIIPEGHHWRDVRMVTEDVVLRTVPYLCTANVQNGFLDWTETKHIDATEDEIVQYSLLADDVLMIEGGDPDKVGRGCLAGTTPEDCIFQNHVFRVRTNKAELIPQFLALYILLPSTKEYFLNCAKQTTGIATINKKQLSSLMVVCPPVAAQAEYIRFAEQADKSKYDSNLNAANTWIGGDMCA